MEMGYWGQLGDEGFMIEKLRKSFGGSKLPSVRYAATTFSLPWGEIIAFCDFHQR